MASAWTVVDTLDAAAARDVRQLLDDVERRTGDEALTEDQQARLDGGVGIRHLLRHGATGALTGYAVAAGDDPWDVEPALGTFDEGLAHRLEHERHAVLLLVRAIARDTEARLVARGWAPVRVLHRMRRALPAPSPPPSVLTVRPFHPGEDDQAWVTLNNAAFAGHPSQADMTVERLRARFDAAWFDPEGFRLYFHGERLAASCWTKVHKTALGDVGEIYVVAVDPAEQGHGFGRVAVLEALEFLTAKGLRRAELFVEEANRSAYALYEDLGFRFAERVVQFGRIAAQPIG